MDWVKEVEIRLQTHKNGVDFENILTDLEDHKAYFSTEAPIKELVSQTIQQAADKIWPSLTPNEQEELSREQQQHTQLLKNTLNSAKSQQALMEQNAEIWKDYCQTLDKVKTVIGRTHFVDEPVSTLAGLHFNVQKITHALNDIQNQQFELDLLLERVNEITSQADQKNKERTEQQSSEVAEEWATLVSDLENRRDTISKLSLIWETFEGRWQNFESLLTGIEEKLKHTDTIVRNKQHVIDTIKYIEELQSEADSLEHLREEVNQLSETVLIYLGESSNASAKALIERLNHLNQTYQGLLDVLREKHSKATTDLEEINKAFSDIAKFKESLSSLLKQIKDFYVFDENVSQTEKNLKNLSDRVQSQISEAKDLISEIRDKYNLSQQLVPIDISQELTNLELLTESLVNAMDEKNREFKKARTVRTDYTGDVDSIQNWIKKAELQIQDRSTEPYVLNQYLQDIQSELSDNFERYEKLLKNGKIIIAKTHNNDEKAIIQTTMDNLNEQLQQLRSLLEDKKQQVGETLDAWQRFLALYQAVLVWVEERKTFLEEPVCVSSLHEARQKLHDYSNAAKTCKVASKNLSEMAKELDYISSVTNVGDLPQKMKHAEEAKTEVEARILKRNALLQETVEEWEQCEKKMKEVRNWMEKSKSSLESAQNKKRPLRDQHAIREKMIGDIQIQKSKIAISVEKLELHFRSGIGGDPKITQAAEDLIKELDLFLEFVRNQTIQLEKAFIQVEQYQMEVQKLRQQIVQLEQQLRTVLAPTYLPHDRDQATRDQQAQAESYRQEIAILLYKIHQLDPNYVQPISGDSVLLGVSYADIAAGRSSPCTFDRSTSEEREVTQNLQISETVSNLTPETRNVIIVEPHTEFNETEIKTMIETAEKAKSSRRGRSPRRHEESILISKPVALKQSLLKPEEKIRTRSPSPMWAPGSTSYSEVLRGQYNHPEAPKIKTEEGWTEMPIHYETHSYNYRPVEIREASYYEQPQSTTMFEYIQPLPDLVGFIASGQQLLNSGLGTYHNPINYSQDVPSQYVERFDQSDNFVELQQYPSDTNTPNVLSQGLSEKPLQPSSVPSQLRPESPNEITKEEVKVEFIYDNSNIEKIDSYKDNQVPSRLGETTTHVVGGDKVIEEIPKDLVDSNTTTDYADVPNKIKRTKKKKSKKSNEDIKIRQITQKIETSSVVECTDNENKTVDLTESIHTENIEEPNKQGSKKNKKKKQLKKEPTDSAVLTSETVVTTSIPQKVSDKGVLETIKTTTVTTKTIKNQQEITSQDADIIQNTGEVASIESELVSPRTNKIIFITHEEVRFTPVVTVKMEFPQQIVQHVEQSDISVENELELEQVIFGSVKERPNMQYVINTNETLHNVENRDVVETFDKSSKDVTDPSKLSIVTFENNTNGITDKQITKSTNTIKIEKPTMETDDQKRDSFETVESASVSKHKKKPKKAKNRDNPVTEVQDQVIETEESVPALVSNEERSNRRKNKKKEKQVLEDQEISISPSNVEQPKPTEKEKKKKKKNKKPVGVEPEDIVSKTESEIQPDNANTEKRTSQKKIKSVSFDEIPEIIDVENKLDTTIELTLKQDPTDNVKVVK
ncbi:hypothetical protein FQR65_LT06177 [Abscondita terminalis]|nr:hypothetical protein FQR65_LT06177 [Abscondita terminalis]